MSKKFILLFLFVAQNYVYASDEVLLPTQKNAVLTIDGAGMGWDYLTEDIK
jgi:hypothetical protein